MPNVETVPNVRYFPPTEITEMPPADEPQAPSWIKRRLTDLGVYSMANTQPPAITLNYSTVLFYMTVLGFIAGGFVWTWQQGKVAGYEAGKQEVINQQLIDRLTRAEAEAERSKTEAQKAKELQLLNSGRK